METNLKAVLVTTEFRGVFFGYTKSGVAPDNSIALINARCAIRWATTGGFLELSSKGPSRNSKIGSRTPKIILYKITSIADVTAEAVAQWEKA